MSAATTPVTQSAFVAPPGEASVAMLDQLYADRRLVFDRVGDLRISTLRSQMDGLILDVFRPGAHYGVRVEMPHGLMIESIRVAYPGIFGADDVNPRVEPAQLGEMEPGSHDPVK